MIDFEKTLLLPLRVRRNCLSGGKYGFTFASSPVALSGKMKPKIMTSCIYFIVLSKVQLPRVDFRQWCLEILQLTSTSNSLVFFLFCFLLWLGSKYLTWKLVGHSLLRGLLFLSAAKKQQKNVFFICFFLSIQTPDYLVEVSGGYPNTKICNSGSPIKFNANKRCKGCLNTNGEATHVVDW